MARFDMSDFEWSVIQPLLPTKVHGVARVDDRRVINGVLWRWRTGAPWAEIPERYGSRKTCYNRFVHWRQSGVWGRLLNAVSETYDGDIQKIYSSSISVHQHGANGDKKGIWWHGTFQGRVDQQNPCARGRTLAACRSD